MPRSLISSISLFQSVDVGRSARQYKILVVDDEPDIREAVRGVLENALRNVRVILAPSGAEGLRILAGEGIDLIVTDYKMPGMNGLEFLEEAKKVAPTVPRILITAFEQELAQELGARSGVDLVFTKPLEPRPLVRICQRILAEGHA